VGPITVLLADDNLIVREGVRALLERDPSIDVLGVAGDYDELIKQAVELEPQVLVTDIRMPPNFQEEGIEAAKEVRKRLPGTGVVVLSQYDSPEYAVDLLSAGAAGYAYLLKDRLADSDRLARAIREVATSHWRVRRQAARRRRYVGFACCTPRSSSARSRARCCRGYCREGWRTSCATTAPQSNVPSGSPSPS
jgi:DNA-binding NarL/FixJ family response regulator